VHPQRWSPDFDDRLPPPRGALPILQPNRAPLGEVTAGWPGSLPPTRCSKSGITRCGMGTDRRPAADFGLPSINLPPTCVMERRTRSRRAARSTSSTRRPTNSPNSDRYRPAGRRRQPLARHRSRPNDESPCRRTAHRPRTRRLRRRVPARARQARLRRHRALRPSVTTDTAHAVIADIATRAMAYVALNRLTPCVIFGPRVFPGVD
jgi:hypothetical protein